ncbi:MAG: zinc dependent phospholipase C family protein [Clostridia bacterium]|nr:zinc dependent phospholipase C family protein [Clostridia bacterium]
MLIATHKLIACIVYDMLKAEMKNLIDRDSFMEGSYSPDTNLKYRKILHDYEHSMYIIDSITNKMANSLYGEKWLGKKLGIICHFIADYCSPYHTNEQFKNKSLIKHLRYETKTHNSSLCLTLTGEYSTPPFDFSSTQTLSSDLKTFIDQYMQDEKNTMKELRFAILNSYSIISMIMSEYLSTHYFAQGSAEAFFIEETPVPSFYQSNDSSLVVRDIQNAQ